jgi:hypothetical protein
VLLAAQPRVLPFIHDQIPDVWKRAATRRSCAAPTRE